ncbi:4-coumarate--CoA ligase-like 7 [Pogonomyrmex barbatus]|uniref:4-coumarate--CoA ligase-like 7 n=1 Tax=Pogonomyrmex barbatus TaxID=144034 RepID=A0A6I9W1N8_9HYME|nr:4-coumarate--CoA ligase-like 7 [Pogonomyrmex barbatus]
MVNEVSKNFIVDNGVYKGKVTFESHLDNYKSFGNLIWSSLKKHGDKVAYLDAHTEETMTYVELHDKAVRCALFLLKQGVKPNDIITLSTNNRLNSIVPCLSAAYINTIFNTWDENMDLQTTLYYLDLIMPKIIFCCEKSVHVVLSAIKEKNCNSMVVVFGKHINAISFSDILRTGTDAEVANFHYVEHDDIKKTACILHSSGTSGLPKAIEVSNYSMIIGCGKTSINMSNSLWFSPLSWMSGIMMNMYAIVHNAKVILYPEFDEDMTCRLIEKYEIRTLLLSTSMTNRFVKGNHIKNYSLLSLKNILVTGAILTPKMQQDLRNMLPHVGICQGYGMTEICFFATFQLPNHKNGSSGTVVDNMQMKIVDPESEKVLGPNQSGEIWLKSPIMMTGYYKNPEATKSTIDNEGWLHSGDIGYIDEDGELFVTDRIKELIKYKGYQVSPTEIENVLMSHPAVLEATVIGIPHELDNEHPLAFIIKKSDARNLMVLFSVFFC